MELAEPWLVEYGRVWALHVLIPALDDLRGVTHVVPGWAEDCRPISRIDWPILFPVALVALVWPRRPVLIVGHLASLASFCSQLPFVWDHMWWTFWCELTFLACFIGCRNAGKASSLFYRSGRIHLVILYFSAVFWKLTTAFLNHETSCATVLFAELAGAMLPADIIPPGGKFASALLQAAPALTVLVEFAVPMSLLIAPRIGVCVSLVFHGTINTLPLTYAGGFSSATSSKMLFFIPGAAGNGLVASPCTGQGTSSLLTASAAPAILIAVALATRPYADSSVCFFALVMFAYARGFPGTSPTPPSPHYGHVTLWRRTLLFALTMGSFIYSFITPMLGVQAMGANTMFASMVHHNGGTGRGNHVIAPLDLLASSIGYGIDDMVRIDAVYGAVNGSFLREMMPVNVFPLLPAHAQALLQAHKNPYYYGSYLYRMECFGKMAAPERDAAVELMDFGSYEAVVLPAYELRRILQEVRSRREKFGLNYTKLPYSLTTMQEYRIYDPDEVGASEARVQVWEDPTAELATCTCGGRNCDSEEHALMPGPPWWLRWILLPYPTPVGADDLSTLRCQT